MNAIRWTALTFLAVLAGACGRTAPSEPAPASEAPATITNRIAVPAAVRSNLGITFAKVELRDVARTIRVPGHFESAPEAHHAYHAALPGKVELLVRQYAPVQRGTPLFRVDSPEWRRMQEELAQVVLDIRRARAELASLEVRERAVEEHATRLDDERDVWVARLRQLETLGAAGGGTATSVTQARSQLAEVATARAEVEEEEADIGAKRSALETELAGRRAATPLLYAEATGAEATGASGPEAAGDGVAHDLALSRAGSLLGVDVAYLLERVPSGGGTVPRWRVIQRLEVTARQDGVVESLAVTDGAWAQAGETVLETVDPRTVRFRGAGLQADLELLRDGMSAVVLPPGRVGTPASAALAGDLTIGLEAEPLTRKIDLILVPRGTERPAWVRAGVSTEMEVVLSKVPEPRIAIPLRAVIQDGLEKVIFRRDPNDPDKVIRIPADLGLSDGRWVVAESGLMEGDEVVHDGVYELMLASGGAKQQGGHFHADGTFHAGPDH